MDLITKVEHLSDKTIVYYSLRQPYGEKDINSMFIVQHSEVDSLSSPPKLGKAYPEWFEEVNIPLIGQTIVFHCSSMRSGGGPPDEGITGPFLKSTNMSALFVTKKAIQADAAILSGARGARKLIVTEIYSSKEEEATNIKWNPPDPESKCQVKLMKDTELAVFNENADQDRHYHKIGTEIYMVLEGAMEIDIDNDSYCLEHGDMIVVNPNTVHEVKKTSKSFLCRVVTINCAGSKDKYIVKTKQKPLTSDDKLCETCGSELKEIGHKIEKEGTNQAKVMTYYECVNRRCKQQWFDWERDWT
jgi:mannose-6-phosphate isomerase-like protein (cupin superfamily)